MSIEIKTVPSSLDALKAHLSIIRLRTQASKASVSGSSQANLQLVPVFNPDTKFKEGLSADRDVSKRSDRISEILRERGPLRVVGAAASQLLSDQIGELYNSHPNFSGAIDYVLGEERLARQSGGSICGLRLLLCGGAGVGKTDFSLSLARILDLPCEVIGLSSSQAAAFLAGSEEYWGNTQPGMVFKQIIQGTHANPLFVLDELDKVTTTWGDPLGALYQLLEPRSSAIFCDKSVPWLRFDASRANWVATANDVSELHPALRSRFVEIDVTAPARDALCAIVQRLYVDLLTEYSVTSRFPPRLAEAQMSAILGKSIREAKRLLRLALAQALRTNCNELSFIIASQAHVPPRIGF